MQANKQENPHIEVKTKHQNLAYFSVGSVWKAFKKHYGNTTQINSFKKIRHVEKVGQIQSLSKETDASAVNRV